MQVQNSKITAPPRPLPSLKEEIRGERRPPDGNLLRARSEKTASWSSGVIPPHPPSAPYWQTLVQPGLPHLVEHRDRRSAFITRGGERNQPRLVGAPSSLLGLPRPGPPARGSGALRRGFLFQLLAERPAYAGRERDARGLVIFNNPSKARWAFCGRARATLHSKKPWEAAAPLHVRGGPLEVPVLPLSRRLLRRHSSAVYRQAEFLGRGRRQRKSIRRSCFSGPQNGQPV